MFYIEGVETLTQADQRDGRFSIPGTISGQDEWCSEQLALVEDVPTNCWSLEWMTFQHSFQPKPSNDSLHEESRMNKKLKPHLQ